jgi:quercetin dioxygenase-like cupin family protein
LVPGTKAKLIAAAMTRRRFARRHARPASVSTPVSEDHVSRLSPRLILLLVSIAVLGAVGGGVATAAIVRATTVERDVLSRFVNPRGADGRTLYLQRVTIPAGAKLPLHFHDGSQIAGITSGTLRYTVVKGGKAKVVDMDSTGETPKVVHTILPGETYDVKAGQGVVEPSGMQHRVEALPGEDVEIYVSSLLENGKPLSVKVELIP